MKKSLAPLPLAIALTALRESYPDLTADLLVAALDSIGTPASPEPSLSQQQFARLNGVSFDTVRRLRVAGKIPHYRVGRQVRIPASAFRAMQGGR